MSDTNLAFMPAYELRDLIAAKTVSLVEVTELYLRRIAALDGPLKPIRQSLQTWQCQWRDRQSRP